MSSDWKGIAAVIAAAAAFVTSVAAIVRQPEEVGAKNGYTELSRELTKLSEDSIKNREDIISLREYLDGVRSREEGAIFDVSDAGVTPSGTKIVHVKPFVAVPRPPIVAPPAATYAPRPYSAVVNGVP